MDDKKTLKNQICEAVAEKGFVEHVAADFGLTPTQIYSWSDRDASFRADLSRARKRGMSSLVAGMILIPDEEADVQRAKLKCDNVRWAASRLHPEVYGDSLQLNVDGQVSLLQARMTHAKGRIIEGECVDDVVPLDGPEDDTEGILL